MPAAIKIVVDSIVSHYPIIAYNGALVLNEQEEIISSNCFSIIDAIKILKFIKYNYPNVAWNLYSGFNWFSPKMAANLVEEKNVKVESQKIEIEYVERLKECHKILLIGKSNIINKLSSILKKLFPNLSLVQSSPIFLEITANNVNKGSACVKLIKHYKVPIDNTWAFGDNFNDKEMLNVVKHSVAMKNAPQQIKDQVEFGTLDNNHDGICYITKSVISIACTFFI